MPDARRIIDVPPKVAFPRPGTPPQDLTMYTAIPHKRINLRVPAEQHAELVRLSKERDVTVQALIRSGIAAVTGVPDEMRRDRRYRTKT